MLNLFYKPTCPYCVRVLTANQEIGATLTLLDTSTGLVARALLLEKGGKTQVPYLEDTDRGVSMYESLDIIEYLAKHYGSGIVPPAELIGNVCPID